MKTRNVYIVLLVVLFAFGVSCSEGAQKKSKNKKKAADVNEPIKLDRTIGDLAEIVALSPIPVKGIGLVVGLPGTGSSECPAATREYLRKYILTQVGRKDILNPDMMINSIDTAVVLVEGYIPSAASKYQAFDILVTALPNTQTTSLAGGRLYTTELKLVARIDESIETSRTLAYAAGPIFIDTLPGSKSSPTSGLVLGGGKVIDNYQITLALYKPDFRAAAYIRNRINQRFGKDVANAASESIISVTVPQAYKDKKPKFIALVKSLYIASLTANEEAQIKELVNGIQTADDKTKYKIGIEAIGKPAINALLPLLDSKDDKARFAAAETLLAIGDDTSLKALRDFAQDAASPFRLDAINTIGNYASQRDVAALMSRLISDNNFDVRYAAYTYLQKLNDPSIVRTIISDDFFVDQVITSGQKMIYVSRKQQAGIVLFGAPLDCDKGIYVEADNGGIIINSEPTDERLSILRKHPVTGGLMGPLKCSTRIVDIIKLLGAPPSPKDDKTRTGLGVSYDEIIAMLKNMVDKGAINATFIAGQVN